VLRDLLWIFVIEHPRMATYQHGQRRVVAELFEIHADAVHRSRADLSIFPRDLQPDLERLLWAADEAAPTSRCCGWSPTTSASSPTTRRRGCTDG
jgi:dGTP triphosphohydrolase